MTIYKLFRNTADNVARRKFSERFFTTYARASAARDGVLKDEVANLKEVKSINARTIGRERDDKTDRVRITAAYKGGAWLSGTHVGFWYEIVKIETED